MTSTIRVAVAIEQSGIVCVKAGDGLFEGEGDDGFGVAAVALPFDDLGVADGHEEGQGALFKRVAHHAPLQKVVKCKLNQGTFNSFLTTHSHRRGNQDQELFFLNWSSEVVLLVSDDR